MGSCCGKGKRDKAKGTMASEATDSQAEGYETVGKPSLTRYENLSQGVSGDGAGRSKGSRRGALGLGRGPGSMLGPASAWTPTATECTATATASAPQPASGVEDSSTDSITSTLRSSGPRRPRRQRFPRTERGSDRDCPSQDSERGWDRDARSQDSDAVSTPAPASLLHTASASLPRSFHETKGDKTKGPMASEAPATESQEEGYETVGKPSLTRYENLTEGVLEEEAARTKGSRRGALGPAWTPTATPTASAPQPATGDEDSSTHSSTDSTTSPSSATTSPSICSLEGPRRPQPHPQPPLPPPTPARPPHQRPQRLPPTSGFKSPQKLLDLSRAVWLKADFMKENHVSVKLEDDPGLPFILKRQGVCSTQKLRKGATLQRPSAGPRKTYQHYKASDKHRVHHRPGLSGSRLSLPFPLSPKAPPKSQPHDPKAPPKSQPHDPKVTPGL